MVREVSVRVYYGGATEEELYGCPDLPQLLSAFHKISSVSLRSLPGSSMSLISCIPEPTVVTDVCLDISDVTVDSVLSSLMAFPAMESLELRGVSSWSSEGLGGAGRSTTRFAALRRFDMDSDILNDPDLLEHIMPQETFANVECLILEDAEVSSQEHVWCLDQLFRKWDTTLKDLQLRKSPEKFGYGASITLPAALESLSFDLSLHGYRDASSRDGISFFARALENHCRAGRTLKSLNVRVDIDDAENALPRGRMVRRFDEIVSAPELGVQHLEWRMHSSRMGDVNRTYGRSGYWVNRNVFPDINKYFLTEEGNRVFGTTAHVLVLS
ncbi:hypothetical protein CYLTODRAFT_447360 [Cylindrobasidium torrendii FP15055 ss-10]|uniref:F-box domain-containing protein n=1 Tax=Cylindrobasidium torrendii FP15055 ss-10 TaxID=1314674 RepID=A0A0D7AUZ1_9AGAR|nr:hypothetical protein CYLTODRAFT_447360 [Cylindrobasidium torrendii FP15055 ss-10]